MQGQSRWSRSTKSGSHDRDSLVFFSFGTEGQHLLRRRAPGAAGLVGVVVRVAVVVREVDEPVLESK